MVDHNVVEEFIGAIRQDQHDKNRTYSAVVSRVDNENTIWVRVAGSDKETPTASTSSEVKRGDSVNVEWRNNKLYIAGNYSNPAAGSIRVAAVERAASQAKAAAGVARQAAESAVEDAGIAKEAADSAQKSADDAGKAADDAGKAAGEATKLANSALEDLSIVEDVIGVLEWVSDHGDYVATEDTSVVEGKYYFARSGTAPDYIYTVVVTPTGDPAAQGWYELESIDEAVSKYVLSHLSLTSRGLWVLPSGMGSASDPQYAPKYKLLLSNDGMYLYDGSGHVVATYGESIRFDSSRPQYIGGEDAYIVFYDSDNDGVPDSISIGGTKVSFGSTKLSEFISAYEASRTAAQAVQNMQERMDSGEFKGEDGVVLRIDSSRGTVFKNNQVSTVLTVTVYSGSDIITNITDLRARFGSGAYLQWYWQKIDESDYGIIVASDHKISRDGFCLTLTPAEVDVKVTFRCELITN